MIRILAAVVLFVAGLAGQALAETRAEQMADEATAFLALLAPEQRAAVVHPFEDDAARVNWSNLPVAMVPREGIELGRLSVAQRVAAHRVLLAAFSSQGYGKAAAIMWLDDILRAQEEIEVPLMAPEQRARREAIMLSRDSGNYWLAFFGEPGSARWGWMLSGHHLAANFTMVDGQVAFTPLFLGASPQTVMQGRYAGWGVLEHEIDRAFTLVGTLDARQRAQMLQGDAVSAELFTGRGRRESLSAPVGLQASRLREDQRDLLWGLINEFVGDVADEAAQAQIAQVRSDGLSRVYLAWWGPTDDPSKRFFYRIHGPSILIEYTREPNAEGLPANHVHAIVRDPRNDYGEGWLERHYQEAHQ
jgi:Protein of unknown function (DUF3500)